MKKELILLGLSGLLVVACDRPHHEPRSNGDRREGASETRTSSAYSERERVEREDTDYARDIDNTGRNVRDRDFNTKTPGDQSEDEDDRMITRRIREIIVEKDDLSTNAKNVKIITIDGVVTLRGVVNTAQEKDFITKAASAVEGVERLENQLEVNNNK